MPLAAQIARLRLCVLSLTPVLERCSPPHHRGCFWHARGVALFDCMPATVGWTASAGGTHLSCLCHSPLAYTARITYSLWPCTCQPFGAPWLHKGQTGTWLQPAPRMPLSWRHQQTHPLPHQPAVTTDAWFTGISTFSRGTVFLGAMQLPCSCDALSPLVPLGLSGATLGQGVPHPPCQNINEGPALLLGLTAGRQWVGWWTANGSVVSAAALNTRW